MLLPDETIVSKIIMLRGQKVILDRDLAKMYGVETRIIKRAVRRNIKRFPEDFMFEMNETELEYWRSQFGISNSGEKMGLRYAPMAFTEHGILMLSSVLRSDKAVETNIQIIRVFNHMRKILATNELLYEKIQAIEHQLGEQNEQIQTLRFEWRKMVECEETDNERVIGFQV